MAIRDLIPWGRQQNRGEIVSSDQQAGNPFLALHREVNRLFDDVFRAISVPSLDGLATSLSWPKLELSETDKEVRVAAELPGLDETDVEVTVEDGVLSIRGEKKSEVEDKDRGYTERSYGRFERQIGLPSGVEEDKATATFDKGVLTITLPKSAEAIESTRRIPINARS